MLLAFTANPGFAAKGNSSVRLQLDPLPAALSGVEVKLRQTPNPQIVVYNHTPDSLVILDDNGRAFLRLDGLGIHGDYATEAYHRSQYAEDQPIPNNAHGAPRWYAISPSPSWGWFDTRLREPAASGRWRIPVQLGEKKSEISGRFVPEPASKKGFQTTITSQAFGVEHASAHPLNGQHPGVFVHNRGNATFKIDGINGEPFLYFRPGKVMVNQASETWRMAAPPDTDNPYKPSKRDKPVWRIISGDGGYGWADPRIQSSAKRSGTKPATWEIPVRANDKKLSITGQITALRSTN